MTEKRFCRFIFTDYDDHTVHYGVKDCQTDEFYSAEDNRNANKLLECLNQLHGEKESYMTEIRRLEEENKFLRNKVATYKSGNALLKKTLDKEWK